MVVRRCGNGDAEEVLIFVDSLDDGGEEEEELRVFVRCLAGLKQVCTRVGCHRPVVVLAAAVDAFERLLVQEADHIVFLRNFLHQVHCEMVVVNSDICRGENRRQLVLRGSNFVMLCFRQNAELPKLCVQLIHKCRYAGLDGSKVLILKLLTFWRLVAEQSAAGIDEVFSRLVHSFIDEEVFLLGADSRFDGRCSCIPE